MKEVRASYNASGIGRAAYQQLRYNASGIGRAAYLEAFCSSFMRMPVTVVEARF